MNERTNEYNIMELLGNANVFVGAFFENISPVIYFIGAVCEPYIGKKPTKRERIAV